jgi:hypothetical protein
MNQRLSSIGMCVLVVGAGIFLLTLLLRPQANIDIQASPEASQITVDGKNSKGGGQRLLPGTHTIAASFGGFSTEKQTVTVPKNGSIKVILLLEPSSEIGRTYLSNHQSEQQRRETLGGTEHNNTVSSLRTTYPILDLLPHSGRGFSIDYGASQKTPDDPRTMALYITVPTLGTEQRALNWIRFSGYNPSDYEIIYQYQDAKD